LVLVGLPGRGKSFIARKLDSYLTWRGNRVRVFNVGQYRRRRSDSIDASDTDECGSPPNGDKADFFSNLNEEAKLLR